MKCSREEQEHCVGLEAKGVTVDGGRYGGKIVEWGRGVKIIKICFFFQAERPPLLKSFVIN